MKTKNSISSEAVISFKESYCDENSIITSLIKMELLDYFIEPILDVGAGIGDISFNSLILKEVILLDVNPISINDNIRPNHIRVTNNFFEYTATKQINTIFICHTQQFLDDDIDMLNQKVGSFNASNFILVENCNNDILSIIINWVKRNFNSYNPEIIHKEFPSSNYELVKEVKFTATLKCNSFDELTDQVIYLMLIEPDNNKKIELREFLKSLVKTPEFKINQAIKVYLKNEK